MTTPRYALLIPVKDGRSAKSRLGVGGDDQRSRLMTAFARDAISAATRCELVQVYVVGEPTSLEILVADLEVEILPDEGEGDLNRALERASQRLPSQRRGTAAMLADLPCLRTDELGAALLEATGRAFVADAAGTGTTLLITPEGSELDPRFGVGSAAAHTVSGAVQVGSSLSSLRLDVDTTADLEAALRYGVGPHTAAVTSSLA